MYHSNQNNTTIKIIGNTNHSTISDRFEKMLQGVSSNKRKKKVFMPQWKKIYRQSQNRIGFLNAELFDIGLLSYFILILIFIALLYPGLSSLYSYNSYLSHHLSELILCPFYPRQSQKRKGFLNGKLLGIGLSTVFSILLYIALVHFGLVSLHIYNMYLSHAHLSELILRYALSRPSQNRRGFINGIVLDTRALSFSIIILIFTTSLHPGFLFCITSMSFLMYLRTWYSLGRYCISGLGHWTLGHSVLSTGDGVQTNGTNAGPTTDKLQLRLRLKEGGVDNKSDTEQGGNFTGESIPENRPLRVIHEGRKTQRKYLRAAAMDLLGIGQVTPAHPRSSTGSSLPAGGASQTP